SLFIYKSFYGGAQDDLSDDLATNFSLLTEGFSYYEILSLVGLSQREQLPVTDIGNLCERFKYGITESEWDKLDKARLDKSGEFIRGRIKGQESAIIRLLEIIKRAKLGLSAGGGGRNQRPRGVLFFAGPTGVGKTEMAKGLAELLFGDESRLIRFDMSEYASPHADQKLLGAPPGYVGYEAGGKLTNAMKEQPFSVLLFDEIEKAHPAIFDKFLQILDDGRLTDGQGDTVYFSESIIIFTSNLGTVTTSQETGERQALVTPEMPYHDVQDTILAAIREHFHYTLGRPEILNRFGENFVVFDYIRPPADEQIVTRLLSQLRDSLAEQQNIQLRFHKTVFEQLVKLARGNLAYGGRGIRNMVDAALINPLAAALFDNDVQAGTEVGLEQIIDHGEQAARRFELRLKTSLKPKG
ncbi:MAG: AAA family ATPase, partial [Pseudomonadota bacterium]